MALITFYGVEDHAASPHPLLFAPLHQHRFAALDFNNNLAITDRFQGLRDAAQRILFGQLNIPRHTHITLSRST